MAYNEPKILIFIGVFFSLTVGAAMPGLGVFLSKLLGWLTAPVSFLKYMDTDFVGTDAEKLESNVNFFSLIMFLLALNSAVSKFFQRGSFGYLGESVTF